jgi:hypothetical protein
MIISLLDGGRNFPSRSLLLLAFAAFNRVNGIIGNRSGGGNTSQNLL